mmetsp:Transcript_135949/g.434948  ORF Transcript_135949/g.434948 Transcript_135949/m.434948 type:complete len:113 (-) Transcript_135949:22-360(-)
MMRFRLCGLCFDDCTKDADYIGELTEAPSGQFVAQVGRIMGASAVAERRSCAFDLEKYGGTVKHVAQYVDGGTAIYEEELVEESRAASLVGPCVGPASPDTRTQRKLCMPHH